MSNDSDITAMLSERKREFFAAVFNGWSFSDPVTMPEKPTPAFAKKTGKLTQDIPGDAMSINRKKGANAFLMVQRKEDQMGFLWCDTDGKAVDKELIEMTKRPCGKGICVKCVKKDLVKMSCCRVVKFAQRGTAVPLVIDDEDRLGQHEDEVALAKVTDPEWN
ncbi:hypothetical protein FBEOM_6435 [Fusarium beomiforme]|uniref:Uncharacterized protein n=1 Tax=Fusarium beomiforme TaxID=44412 RepID=A0A9P5AKQ8_9HYPO|nr:hypothetical protein FBEOM_6435 [Fusarium beomiforme]